MTILGSDRPVDNCIGFVQRELDRIAVALREAPSPECYARLYAAQQALSWALEPTGFMAPYAAIPGTLEATTDCPVCPEEGVDRGRLAG